MLKKIFVVIISIVLLNCADASAFTCDFSEYTPTNALIRSAIMPGWGQGWNYQRTKGWIVFGVFAVSVFGAFYYLNKSECEPISINSNINSLSFFLYSNKTSG